MIPRRVFSSPLLVNKSGFPASQGHHTAIPWSIVVRNLRDREKTNLRNENSRPFSSILVYQTCLFLKVYFPWNLISTLHILTLARSSLIGPIIYTLFHNPPKMRIKNIQANLSGFSSNLFALCLATANLLIIFLVVYQKL